MSSTPNRAGTCAAPDDAATNLVDCLTIAVMTVRGVVEFDPLAIAAAVMVTVVAALHVYFLVLEMFLWRTPIGLRTFRMTREAADSSAVLAANQGFTTVF